MKHSIYAILMVAIIAGITMQSCKKEEKENAKLNEEFKQFNDDGNYYKQESDQADSDINNVVSDPSVFGRSAGLQSSPLCGVTIDSSQIAQKILFFNFDGSTSCFSPSRIRSGQIKAQLTSGAYWSDVNAVLTITYINFKVTRQSNNHSIQLNGVKTLRNVNGNNWLAFLAGTTSLKYQARASNIQVVFENGSTAIWNVARMTEWNYVANGPGGNPNFQFTSNGDTTLNGFTTVDSWGVNRFGQPFTSFYTSPWASNSYCGLWRPTSGELIHNVTNGNFAITLGVDVSGNPSTGTCAYGFKVTWTVNGNSNDAVFSY